MSNKISLIFEKDEFNIYINDNVIFSDTDLDKTITKYKQIIVDNTTVQGRSWDSIIESINEFKDSTIEINSEFKTLTYKLMKYFHNSGKLMYMGNDQMTPLMGGYNLFYYLIKLSKNIPSINYEDILKLCKYILNHKGSYRINESSLIISSPAFNYGSAEYDFYSNKINKGASITTGSFAEFKGYVMGIIH